VQNESERSMMDIPYGKLAIYVLTFVGYIYSGYGSGLLTNLRDAVISAESIFGDVFHNVIKVAKNFRNFHDIFDAAVEENCVFKCPTGERGEGETSSKRLLQGRPPDAIGITYRRRTGAAPWA
jgi:hypothetical protein